MLNVYGITPKITFLVAYSAGIMLGGKCYENKHNYFQQKIKINYQKGSYG